MRVWKDLDRILRGDATRSTELKDGTLNVSAVRLVPVLVLLGMVYGACMGSFALFGGGSSYWQVIASMVKVPVLFLLTLVVTLPSLYVFNALVGSRLGPSAVVRLLLAALAVMVTVLASLGPIVAFFSVSTTSYPFMLLLNVVVFAVSGFLGLAFLRQTLHRLSPSAPRLVAASSREPELTDAPESLAAMPPRGALEPEDDRVLGRHVKLVFGCWVIVFGFVGAQMGWVLRPFVGNPGQPFTWFRPRESNFFEAVLRALGSLFG